jgi:HK97 family phage major capsid protein
MQILLRKIGGVLTPVLRTRQAPSFGVRAGPSAVFNVLLSPLVLAVLAIAFVVAFLVAHPSNAAHASPFGLFAIGQLNVRELLAKRANLIDEARKITNKADEEKRALTTEEDTRFGKLFGEAEEIRKSIKREEDLAQAERELAETRTREEREREQKDKKDPANPEQRANPRGTPEYRNAFSRFLTVGREGMTPEEKRALSVGIDTAGGFTTAAEQFVNELIKNVDNLVFIRQLATKRPVPTAMSLGVPTLDTDPDDADWTSELGTGSEDSSMAFGKRKMIPHPLAKRIKVSNDFLRQTVTGGESLVRERLAYKNAISQEKGFMTGTGVQQPLGLFTASADGIPTTRDYSTGNSTTAPTFDGLLGAKYQLKVQYRMSSAIRWIFHPDTLLILAKIKDGNGQYIWRESVRAGEPDRILNIPFAESQYAPNTFTTGLYVGLLGDISFYWVADAYDYAVKRLDELYAETNQVGFIGRGATDGQAVLAEAFVRVKLA